MTRLATMSAPFFPDEISPPPGLSAFDRLAADHRAQRRAVDLILAIASGDGPAGAAEALSDFLAGPFAHHQRIEEESLFPALLASCRPEDGIGALLARIRQAKVSERAARAGEVLGRIAGGAETTEETQEFLHSFAQDLHRHLAIEESALLPIARVRLGGEALRLIDEAMRERPPVAGQDNKKDRGKK